MKVTERLYITISVPKAETEGGFRIMVEDPNGFPISHDVIELGGGEENAA